MNHRLGLITHDWRPSIERIWPWSTRRWTRERIIKIIVRLFAGGYLFEDLASDVIKKGVYAWSHRPQSSQFVVDSFDTKSAHWISQEPFDLESPNLIRTPTPTCSTAAQDMTSLTTSGRKLSRKTEENTASNSFGYNFSRTVKARITKYDRIIRDNIETIYNLNLYFVC